MMLRGKVKWFNDDKGYGVIEQQDGQEVFVHYTSIIGEGFKTLIKGSDVEFEAVHGEMGLQAIKVRLL